MSSSGTFSRVQSTREKTWAPWPMESKFYGTFPDANRQIETFCYIIASKWPVILSEKGTLMVSTFIKAKHYQIVAIVLKRPLKWHQKVYIYLENEPRYSVLEKTLCWWRTVKKIYASGGALDGISTGHFKILCANGAGARGKMNPGLGIRGV